jgi:hypothetical protein
MENDLGYNVFHNAIGIYLVTFYLFPIILHFYFSDSNVKLTYHSKKEISTQKNCIYVLTSNANEHCLSTLMKYWEMNLLLHLFSVDFSFIMIIFQSIHLFLFEPLIFMIQKSKNTIYWKFYQSIIDFLHSNSCDWAYRAIDDTFLNISLLTKFLNSLNQVYHPKSDVFIKG